MKSWQKLPPYLVLLLIVGIFTSYHFWRIGTPLENRLTINRLMFNETDFHDGLSAYMTAKNYYQDGWSREYAIPNRKGVTTQGYWGIPCAKNTPLTPATKSLQIPHPTGKVATIYPDNQDCFYTHNPPLTDWIWGGIYQIGFKSFIEFKQVALFFNALTCFALLAALLQYFSLPAVAFGGSLWMSLYYQIVWSSSLYHHPWQYLFVAFLIMAAKKEHKGAFFLSSFFIFYTNLFLVAFPFLGLILVPKNKRLSFLYATCVAAFLAFLLFYTQRAFFFHSLLQPFIDIFSDAMARYQTTTHIFEILKGYITGYLGRAWFLIVFFIFGLYFSFKQKSTLTLFFILSAFSLWVLRPSYALAHIHQWFALFCFVYLIFAVAIIQALLSYPRQKKFFFHIIAPSLVLSALVYENGSRLHSDFQYTNELKRFNEANDLSKAPLVLFYTQTPSSENPWTDYEKGNVLIDGILRQVQFPYQIRPTAIELKSIKEFSIFINFLDEQRFNTITFDFLGEFNPHNFKCHLINSSKQTNNEVTLTRIESLQRFSLTFPDQAGKSFTLSCTPQTSITLYEMGIFQREQR